MSTTRRTLNGFILAATAATTLLVCSLEATDWVENYNNNNQTVITRTKRQAFLRCPSQAAGGGDGGASSGLIFYSAGERRDVKLEYGRDGWTARKVRSLAKLGFNASRPTLLYAHAYMQSSRSRWLQQVRRNYDKMFRLATDKVKTASFNLMLFDWSRYSNLQYGQSVSWAPHLGRILGEFLNVLGNEYDYDLDTQLHLVSYSLSTHIAGLAGRYVRNQSGGAKRVAQITALDPTGVCFYQANAFGAQMALKPTDARLVVARHYDMGMLGARHPIGGVDIFINGGKNQPLVERSRRGRASAMRNVKSSLNGTEEDEEQEELLVFQQGRFGQSHARAADHEVSREEDKECHEVAYECRNYQAFKAGECADCGPKLERCYYLANLASMRYQAGGVELRGASYRANTKMYLRTGNEPGRFCLHHYQVLVELKSTASRDTSQLLASGSLTFNFGPQLAEVKATHQMGASNRFTGLILRQTRLADLNRISPRLNGRQLPSNDELNLLEQLESFQLNYMSHPLPGARQRLSLRLCSIGGPTNNDSRPVPLVQC